MIHTGTRRPRRALVLPGVVAAIACYHANNTLPHVLAWSANRNNLPICTAPLPLPSMHPEQPSRPRCPLLSSSSRNIIGPPPLAKRRRSSLSSTPAADNENLPTSESKNTRNKQNTDRNNDRRTKHKNRNKKGGFKNGRPKSKRKGPNKNKNNNNNNNKRKNGNNKNPRRNNNSNNNNNINSNRNRSNARPQTTASATTVSELVQTVRAVLSNKPQTDDGLGHGWRTAWSVLKREATIPYDTTLEDVSPKNGERKHTTVLPVRVYHDVLESMKKEKRCWQDAIRLVTYMERGGSPSESAAAAAASVSSSNHHQRGRSASADKYNARPWHIPSPNYEIYHTLIECLWVNGGGRKDAHDASVYWLSKMLRKLEADLNRPTTGESDNNNNNDNNDDDKESANDIIVITNRDRKLVRNSIQVVLGSLSKQRKWRDALQLLEYTEILSRPDNANVPLTVVQYNTVLTCLARSRQVGQCQRLLHRLQRHDSLRPDEISYNAVISACSAVGRWKEALKVLDECYAEQGVEPNIYIYTNAMRACAKAGNTQKALSLLQIVKDKGLPVDNYCYTAVIDACAKGKQWKKALELFDEMEAKGIEPTQVTYSVTISALGNGLQWERALWLLNLMRDKGMKVNPFTYNAAITALAKSSKNRDSAKQGTDSANDDEELWPRALDLLRQMKEDGIEPDDFCYSSAINCCAADGRWEEACELIETMKRGGPKSRPNKVAYTAAISACGRAGQGSKALELFQNMRDDGLAADRVAYNALFSALRVSKDADRAYELWGEICGRRKPSQSSPIATARDVASPDIITLTDCIATLSRAGYTEQMDEVFREAVERGIVLGRNNNDLDEQWEIDLSGLPLPIARAAARYLLHSIVQKHRDGGTHKPDESNRLQDMIFITGIGKAQQKRRVESSSATPPAATPSNKVLERKDRTTSLREFIQAILETDFEPPLESIVPKRAQGTVVIEEAKLARWLNEERGRVVTAKSSARSD